MPGRKGLFQRDIRSQVLQLLELGFPGIRTPYLGIPLLSSCETPLQALHCIRSSSLRPFPPSYESRNLRECNFSPFPRNVIRVEVP